MTRIASLPIPTAARQPPETGPWRDVAVQYALAVALVGIAHAASVVHWRVQSPLPYTLFLSAVVISALYGGYGPGALATGLASLDIAYAFIPPYNSTVINLDKVIFVATFTAVAALTSFLQARRRAAEASLRRAHDELERRVDSRTAELTASREQLALLVNDILLIAEREQQRIGHDLHDGLGQELTGISMLSVALAERLRAERSAAGEYAEEVAGLIQQSIRHTRDLARGLCPVDLEDEGLPSALSRLADRVSRLPGVRCTFDQHGDPATDDVTNVHLYRIAQEAINNALRHGQAKSLTMSLHALPRRITLGVTDDGSGFSPDAQPAGMGLRLMRYRARMVGATLDIGPGPAGGTSVTCELAEDFDSEVSLQPVRGDRRG